MKYYLLLSIFLISHFAYALDSCNECHDKKWQQTPAHNWLNTEEHLDVSACVDCHRWEGQKDLPPVLPSQATLVKDCGGCHDNLDELAEMMGMTQYQQAQD